jgi:folate-binding protein YgfZ
MQNTELPIEAPLAALHHAAGANMGIWFGCTMPDDWGNPREEQRLANETVALIDKNYRAYLAFTGPDRIRYLNAMLTNNVKDLAKGQGVISLLLNAQGRILAEIETFADPEKMFCVSYRMIRQNLLEVFDKYIIMDDVTLSDESEKFGTLALEGPLAAKIVDELTGLDLAMLSPLGWTEILVKSCTSDSSAPSPCRLVKRSGDLASTGEFVVQSKNLEPLWNILLKAAQQHGGGPMGYKALSAQRLVQGTPWFGYDFGEKQIPHEAALESSHISYTKGCYTGQEIVERVRSRGQVNRRRVELLFSGASVPENGASLTVDDQPVGFVTRAAKSWFPPCILGMGYLGKVSRAPGTTLNWSGGTATVVEFKDAVSAGSRGAAQSSC